MDHMRLDRRTVLAAGGMGFCGLLPGTVAADVAARAKSAILIWLTGGPSHIDLWDMKPTAPSTVRGEFKPIATSSPEITLCEHLPHLAKQAHHLAIVRSLGHYNRARNDHHTGYYYNLTGHQPEPPFLNSRRPRPDDWPYLGCVVGSKRPPHPYLPNVISLPQMAGEPGSYRPGQFAARIGVQHDPLFVLGDLQRPLRFRVPSLVLQRGVSRDRLNHRRGLLSALSGQRQFLERAARRSGFSDYQERAFSLLTSQRSQRAFDVAREPESVREKYGPGLNATVNGNENGGCSTQGNSQ